MQKPGNNEELIVFSFIDITHKKQYEKEREELLGILLNQKAALEKLNDELLKKNKDLEEFAYIASQDLQEPLRVITGYIGLLEKRYSGLFDNDAREFSLILFLPQKECRI
jgi:light-regulated signal transduction histidine kinase (bacteriophytochrome)